MLSQPRVETEPASPSKCGVRLPTLSQTLQGTRALSLQKSAIWFLSIIFSMALLMLNIPWAGCDGWGRAFLLWVGQWKIKLGKVHLEKIQPVKYTLEKYLEKYTLEKYALEICTLGKYTLDKSKSKSCWS